MAKNLLVQTALTALALDPQVAIFLLEEFQLLLAFDVDLFDSVRAVVANSVLLTLQ